MRTIWKYEIVNGPITHAIPDGFRIVHCGLDPSKLPCIWAEVEPNNAMKSLHLTVVGTGHSIPPGFEVLGSYVQSPFVWHIIGMER